ncbi:MAG: hypothetical protein QX193_07635 [Methylococcales bacterium]|nr:hypothetical protein [Methylococcales bacterium]
MGNSSLIYQEKLKLALQESQIHLQRMDIAFEELKKRHSFPIQMSQFLMLLEDNTDVAFADQIIYRYSKAQDCMGAKLFKAFMQYQGENVDKPFRDILNLLEKWQLLEVEEWFVLREIRNEIAHDYENDYLKACQILNSIEQSRAELWKIFNEIQNKTKDASPKSAI